MPRWPPGSWLDSEISADYLLTVAAAVDLLHGFRSGGLDPAGLVADPVLVVDADSGGDPSELEVPPGFPAVVIVASAHGAPPLSSRGPDVAVTGRLDPPAPWVAGADPRAEATALADGVRAAPGAALALVHVLRNGVGRSADDGIVLESLAYSMLQSGPEFQRWKKGRPAPPARPDAGPAVLVAREGDRMELTLNRPAVHNAYSWQMRDALYEALAVAGYDPECSVYLRGAGPSFCSGGDLDQFGTFPDPVTSHMVRTARSPARLLALLSPRVTALIHGSCAGSGIELPAFAARLIARPGTRMWLPELALGLIPGAGGTVSIRRRIGRGRTAWMGLTGRPVDAATGLAWGLVDEVAEHDPYPAH
jgi:enoyl-CoA hydratase/carnithine racemase